MFDEDRWYPRLADMPGIEFTGSPGVARDKLRGASVRPAKRQWGEGWEWPERDGQHRAPAETHRCEDWAELSTERAIRNVWECLELPGSLADWHFLLQDAIGELWGRRHTDPAALGVCEQFALLDLKIARARPQAFSTDAQDGAQGYVTVRAFEVLVKLYRAMDDLPAALTIARQGQDWGSPALGKSADEIQVQLDAGL